MFRTVRLGTPIILLVLGAIMHYALHLKNTHSVDLDKIGVILMIAGGAWLLLEVLVNGRRAKTTGNDRVIYSDHDDRF